MSLSLAERRIISTFLRGNPSFNYLGCTRINQDATQCVSSKVTTPRSRTFNVLLSALLGGSAYFVYQFFKESNLVQLRENQEGDSEEQVPVASEEKAKPKRRGFREQKVRQYGVHCLRSWVNVGKEML